MSGPAVHGPVAGVGRVRIKVCGVTRPQDALAAEAAGVDAVGLIFAPGSRRRVDLARAAEVVADLGAFVARVGVFVAPAPGEVDAAVARLRLHAVQLHDADGTGRGDAAAGRVDPAWIADLRQRVAVVRAVAWRPGLAEDSLAEVAGDLLLVDGPRAGSGVPFDWAAAAGLRRLGRLRRWALAGGLDAGNVGAAIARLRPWAVDVASGVEAAPGVKDPRRIAAFVRAVRVAEEAGGGPGAAP